MRAPGAVWASITTRFGKPTTERGASPVPNVLLRGAPWTQTDHTHHSNICTKDSVVCEGLKLVVLSILHTLGCKGRSVREGLPPLLGRDAHAPDRVLIVAFAHLCRGDAAGLYITHWTMLLTILTRLEKVNVTYTMVTMQLNNCTMCTDI